MSFSFFQMFSKRTLAILRPALRPTTFLPVQNASSRSAKFNYEDAFDLESQLTDDERMVRDQFRNYCQDKLMKRVIEANRKESKTNEFEGEKCFFVEVFHKEIMNELGELGVLGPTIHGDERVFQAEGEQTNQRVLWV